MSEKVSNHYLDNKAIHEELVEYVLAYRKSKAENTKPPRLSNNIGKAIIDTITNFSYTHKYSGYPYREDMVLEAIYIVTKYAHNYDYENYKNPHAYITFIGERLFWRYIKREKAIFAGKQKMMKDIDISAYDTQEFDKDEDFRHILKEILVANTVVIDDGEKKDKAPRKKRERQEATLDTLFDDSQENDE